MKHNFLKFLPLGILFIIFSLTAQAQSGKIEGKVVDKKSGETLIGLTVGIDGTTKGAVTDIEGRFVVANLAPGKYSVTFRYLGYQSQTVTGVEVKADAATTLNISMEESAQQALNEVVVTATYRQATVGALYAQQKNAVAISDGISSDVIKKSPDRNTGEVIKRVSGASVQDNKFIIIRGLSDRYNNALINNTPLPSTEPDRKTFSFDIIPSNLIDNVIISKTATADIPGDFAGGVIQIKTKDFPTTKTLEIGFGLGYNSVSTFKDFYGRSPGVNGYASFGASEYHLPSSFPATRTRYLNKSLSERVQISKQFDNTWGIDDLGAALPTQNLSFVFGNAYSLKNEGKLGLILSANYRNGQSISPESRNDFNEVSNGQTTQSLFRYNDTYYNFSSNLGVLANLSYIKGNNKYALKNLLNNTYENNYLSRIGSVTDLQQYRKVSQQEVIGRRLINSVLEGDHLINEKTQSKINWNVSFSNFNSDQPDLRRLSYSKDLSQANNESVPFQAGVPTVATPSTSGRFYSDLNENILGGAINYTTPFTIAGKSQVFKAGILKQYKYRDVTARVLGYTIHTNSYSESQRLLALPQGELFAEENIEADRFYIDDITNPNNKYDGSADLNAGFAMLTSNFSEKFKATYGLRVENYIETLNSADNSGNPLKVSNNYLDFLPSLNLTYSLSEKTNLRASYSSTVARAQFRELAPFTFYNFVTELVNIGNPNIKRTKISNYDLRYEFYPVSGQMFSVSSFYKSMTNPIETSILPGSTAASKSLSYINAPNANVYGAEFEVRRNLGIISESSALLKNLTFTANAAYIKSEVDFSGSANIATIENKRELQGQSPYLINTSLQYASANSGWQGSVLYNRIGRRISVVGFGHYDSSGSFVADYPNIYEAPRNVLDFQLSKSFAKQKAELKFNLSNVLDSKANFYQDLDLSKKYESNGNDQLINSIQYGRSFSVSFGYKF